MMKKTAAVSYLRSFTAADVAYVYAEMLILT